MIRESQLLVAITCLFRFSVITLSYLQFTKYIALSACSESTVITLYAYVGGNATYVDGKFMYLGGHGAFSHEVDTDYICWSTFESICKKHGDNRVVDQVWYKSRREHMAVARPIIVDKDEGIRMMCVDAIKWGDIVLYINLRDCNYTPLLLLTWKPTDAVEVDEGGVDVDDQESVAQNVGESVDQEEDREEEAAVGEKETEDAEQEAEHEAEEGEEEEEESEDEAEHTEEEDEVNQDEGAPPADNDAQQIHEDPIPHEVMGEAEFESIFGEAAVGHGDVGEGLGDAAVGLGNAEGPRTD